MSADSWQQRLRQAAARRRQLDRVRVRRVLEPGPGPMEVRHHDRTLINFSSNDYLGLSRHPAVLEAYSSAAASACGSGASALVTGYRPEHQRLEQSLAKFLDRDAALVFSSGYLANLALGSALLKRGDVVVEDRLNHASLIDAARLSDAELRRYPHGDIRGAEQQLAREADGLRLLVSDGVFSMDGDIAAVGDLAALARKYDAWLCIDDAHGIGVLGAAGRGTLFRAGLDQDDVAVLVGTFGKTLGAAGAFIAGSQALIDHLLQSARSYIYTTAMPAAQAVAVTAALEVLEQEPERVSALQARIQLFSGLADRAGLSRMDSSTAIQPLVLGEDAAALQASDCLQQHGYLVSAIRPPTVPEGSARLRITLSSAHTEEQICGLVEALAHCMESTNDDH